MNNQSHFSTTAKSPFKLFTALALAAGVTFALFALMQELISSDQASVVTPEPAPVIVFVYENEDKPGVEKVRVKPKPVPKKIPEPIPQMVDAESDNELASNYQPAMAKVAFENEFSNTFDMNEGDTRPLVRMQPKYPVDAAREGVEGWVKLVFSIDASGQVKDIKVIDSQPKRTFDRAARQALKKWKYKPQVTNGTAVTREGLEVVLDFKLNSDAA